jgi:[glutamine synthetase] adenylyltransferase / [glutamine synthetase]-adenylyl-L-tyrosine phosphorylase
MARDPEDRIHEDRIPEDRIHDDRIDLLLASSPAPEQGRRYLARFPHQLITPENARALIAIFTHSHFLSEEVIQHPDWIAEPLDLDRVIERSEYRARLRMILPPGLPDPLVLAAFRRRQILRIVIRDVLGFGTLPEITAELSGLADAIVETAYRSIRQELISRFGRPMPESGDKSEAHFAVIALGKLGGVELNYSSDIDLMFLYSANGETSGPERITNKEFFKRAANQLTAILSTYTTEGLCYRVDLRLRPDGRLGEVCISLEGARQYYANRARDWELQMMIKARAAAGDRALGRALLDFVEPRTYASTLDFSAVEALSATRERINEKLAAKRPAGRGRGAIEIELGIDVKLERGGIRDIEFVVQCLQRLHGGAEPWVRHGGTLLALARLHDKGFLSDAEYGQLASAYQFLRHVEHRLQFADDLQTHTLPRDRDQLELLARRMPDVPISRGPISQGPISKGPISKGKATDWLLAEIRRHFEQVIEIYQRVVHAGREPADDSPAPAARTSNVVRALDQRAPAVSAALSSALSQGDMNRGYRAFEHFLERASVEELALLDRDPALMTNTLDIFEHSPYFAEELIRAPDLVDEIGRVAGDETAPDKIGELRHWFRRQILRIESRSICRSHPIFDTLAETSELAEAVITRAYAAAVQEILATHPPQQKSYQPAYQTMDQMWVIALGRLGMREFDLASDADLVFVLADSDSAEMRFWTRVAERLIDLITAYTGGGFLFAVDTRLRPNGADGPLVQTESAFKDYFANAAEAWEGITYMKSRAVAGDAKRAESFLHELQQVDWERYGQGGRSRTDLRQMRLRLEQEQGSAQPLKSGRGGYYDIDFILMYLRLKSAGIFFKVLNTPARIEVIENMGLLDRASAHFLHEAASFYRALDHGLRLISGHAEAKLPSSEAQMETLGALLKRWTPVPIEKLGEIQTRTREMFDRIFV